MGEEQKSLTSSQKADKLWSKLKRKAEEIRFGRLTMEVVIFDGQITQLEVSRSTEVLRAD